MSKLFFISLLFYLQQLASSLLVPLAPSTWTDDCSTNPWLSETKKNIANIHSTTVSTLLNDSKCIHGPFVPYYTNNIAINIQTPHKNGILKINIKLWLIYSEKALLNLKNNFYYKFNNNITHLTDNITYCDKHTFLCYYDLYVERYFNNISETSFYIGINSRNKNDFNWAFSDFSATVALVTDNKIQYKKTNNNKLKLDYLYSPQEITNILRRKRRHEILKPPTISPLILRKLLQSDPTTQPTPAPTTESSDNRIFTDIAGIRVNQILVGILCILFVMIVCLILMLCYYHKKNRTVKQALKHFSYISNQKSNLNYININPNGLLDNSNNNSNNNSNKNELLNTNDSINNYSNNSPYNLSSNELLKSDKDIEMLVLDNNDNNSNNNKNKVNRSKSQAIINHENLTKTGVQLQTGGVFNEYNNNEAIKRKKSEYIVDDESLKDVNFKKAVKEAIKMDYATMGKKNKYEGPRTPTNTMTKSFESEQLYNYDLQPKLQEIHSEGPKHINRNNNNKIKTRNPDNINENNDENNGNRFDSDDLVMKKLKNQMEVTNSPELRKIKIHAPKYPKKHKRDNSQSFNKKRNRRNTAGKRQGEITPLSSNKTQDQHFKFDSIQLDKDLDIIRDVESNKHKMSRGNENDMSDYDDNNDLVVIEDNMDNNNKNNKFPKVTPMNTLDEEEDFEANNVDSSDSSEMLHSENMEALHERQETRQIAEKILDILDVPDVDYGNTKGNDTNDNNDKENEINDIDDLNDDDLNDNDNIIDDNTKTSKGDNNTVLSDDEKQHRPSMKMKDDVLDILDDNKRISTTFGYSRIETPSNSRSSKVINGTICNSDTTAGFNDVKYKDEEKFSRPSIATNDEILDSINSSTPTGDMNKRLSKDSDQLIDQQLHQKKRKQSEFQKLLELHTPQGIKPVNNSDSENDSTQKRVKFAKPKKKIKHKESIDLIKTKPPPMILAAKPLKLDDVKRKGSVVSSKTTESKNNNKRTNILKIIDDNKKKNENKKPIENKNDESNNVTPGANLSDIISLISTEIDEKEHRPTHVTDDGGNSSDNSNSELPQNSQFPNFKTEMKTKNSKSNITNIDDVSNITPGAPFNDDILSVNIIEDEDEKQSVPLTETPGNNEKTKTINKTDKDENITEDNIINTDKIPLDLENLSSGAKRNIILKTSQGILNELLDSNSELTSNHDTPQFKEEDDEKQFKPRTETPGGNNNNNNNKNKSRRLHNKYTSDLAIDFLNLGKMGELSNRTGGTFMSKHSTNSKLSSKQEEGRHRPTTDDTQNFTIKKQRISPNSSNQVSINMNSNTKTKTKKSKFESSV